MVSFSYLGSS